MSHISYFLGIIFAIIGAFSAFADIALGLGATNWLLLAIAAFLAANFPAIGLAISWYLKTTEPESKKEE